MENKPEFRIVGNAPEEKKEAVKEELIRRLFDNFNELPQECKEKLRKLECPKSDKELVLIDFADKFTNNLMMKAGVGPYNIPSDNYRIIPPELYEEFAEPTNENEMGSAHYSRQGLLFNAKFCRRNPLDFGALALHETLHLKGGLTQEVGEYNGNEEKTVFTAGISALSSQKTDHDKREHRHHKGLDEAIVTRAEKMAYHEILRIPILAEEKKWMESDEAKEKIKKIAITANRPEDDIIFVERDSDQKNLFAYYRQRQVLDLLCGEIQKDNPDKYKSTEDVFGEFLRAHFTGKLIAIVKLVDGSFGEGGFRILGNMDETNQSGVLHFETMKMLRRKHLKLKKNS